MNMTLLLALLGRPAERKLVTLMNVAGRGKGALRRYEVKGRQIYTKKATKRGKGEGRIADYCCEGSLSLPYYCTNALLAA